MVIMSEKRRKENFSFDERMTLIEMVKKRILDIKEKRNDSAANRKKQLAWSSLSEDMAASFPEGPKRKANDWKELWRRMKMKAKAKAREKKADLVQTGGGKAVVGDVGEEHLAVLNLIIGELEQFHNTWDDDSPLYEKAAESPKNHQEQRDEVDSDQVLSGSNRPTTSEVVEASAVKETKTEAASQKKSKASQPADMVVLHKTDEAMSYLQREHEEKMKLIFLQQEAAISKKRASDAKRDYYIEKRRKYRDDL